MEKLKRSAGYRQNANGLMQRYHLGLVLMRNREQRRYGGAKQVPPVIVGEIESRDILWMPRTKFNPRELIGIATLNERIEEDLSFSNENLSIDQIMTQILEDYMPYEVRVNGYNYGFNADLPERVFAYVKFGDSEKRTGLLVPRVSMTGSEDAYQFLDCEATSPRCWHTVLSFRQTETISLSEGRLVYRSDKTMETPTVVAKITLVSAGHKHTTGGAYIFPPKIPISESNMPVNSPAELTFARAIGAMSNGKLNVRFTEFEKEADVAAVSNNGNNELFVHPPLATMYHVELPDRAPPAVVESFKLGLPVYASMVAEPTSQYGPQLDSETTMRKINVKYTTGTSGKLGVVRDKLVDRYTGRVTLVVQFELS